MTTSYAPKLRPAANRTRTSSAGTSTAITFSVTSERWRFIAYLFFWGMSIFAITMSKIFVVPMLAAGPADGDTCGPFNRDAPDFGVHLGEGFDFKTQSHLMQLFGFNNICSNWDYSPSRESTAMVYPLFEYSLIVYLCLDFMATAIAHQRGELDEWFWKASKIIFPITIVLCSQFRMIFVCLAYENVKSHTAGFLGLQIALMLVAVQNTLFVWDANIKYEQLGSDIKYTRRAALAYLIGDLIICSFKITATIYVVRYGHGAPWTLAPSFIPGKRVGQVVDIIWMIFNAVIPLFIANFRSKNEVPLTFTVTQNAVYVDDETVGERAPLTGNTFQQILGFRV